MLTNFLFIFQAIAQQKFREQQITEHRKRLEEQRARDQDKFVQVEERRRAIESGKSIFLRGPGFESRRGQKGIFFLNFHFLLFFSKFEGPKVI